MCLLGTNALRKIYRDATRFFTVINLYMLMNEGWLFELLHYFSVDESDALENPVEKWLILNRG